MNVEIGTVAKQFLFLGIFGIGSLQCGRSGSYLKKTPFSYSASFIPRLKCLASMPGVEAVGFVTNPRSFHWDG